ncbi:MAG: hypothetical protein WAN31_05900 [Methylovirgula sp.]
MPTDFLEAAGTNGFIATPFNLLSTELNSLGSTDTAVSSVGGTSGVFSQSNYANAIWAAIYFYSGGSFTPTGSPYIAGWFLFSPDGGSTFEATASNTALARPPDFIIPLLASAYASGNQAQASGIVRVPWWSNKVFIQNNAGVALPSSGNLIKAAPVAVQY